MVDDGVFIAAPDLLAAPPVACRNGHHARLHFALVSGSPASSLTASYHYQDFPPPLNVSSTIGLLLRDPLAASSLHPPKSLSPLQEVRPCPSDVLQQMTLELASSKTHPKNGLRQCSR